MSAEDELEALLRSRQTAREAQARALEEQQATQAAEAARHAAGFIALMKRRGVRQEPVYSWHQAKNRGNKVTAEVFTPVYSGWVVRYALSEYDEPWLILCLNESGMFSCDARRPSATGYPSQGLVANPKSAFRSIRSGGWVLCAPQENGQPKITLRAPYISQNDYAKAAEWYL